MVVPANFAAVQGQTVISADNLNTTIQTVYNYAALRAFSSAVANQVVFCMGSVSPLDGGQAHYIWSPTATGPDNGNTIIMPTGNVQGAWVAFYPLPTWAQFGEFFAPFTPSAIYAQSPTAPYPLAVFTGSTFSGYYGFIGIKTVFVSFNVAINDTQGLIGAYFFNLPPVGTPNLWAYGACREYAHTGVIGTVQVFPTDVTAALVRYDGGGLITKDFNIAGSLIYTIA